MKRKGSIIIVICIVLIGLYISFDIFSHSSIEKTIRTDLFSRGYYVNSFRTEISKRLIPDSQYGTVYICRSPAIGPDAYKISYKYKYFGKLKYWYVNPAGTGGG